MFTQDDLMKYRGIKKIITEGQYQIKGEAVIMAASLFIWFNELEKKISDNIEVKKPMKPVGAPKKIGE